MPVVQTGSVVYIQEETSVDGGQRRVARIYVVFPDVAFPDLHVSFLCSKAGVLD